MSYADAVSGNRSCASPSTAAAASSRAHVDLSLAVGVLTVQHTDAAPAKQAVLATLCKQLVLLQQGSPQETTEELRFDEPGPPLLLLSDSTLFQVHDMDWMEKGRKQEFLAEEASGFILVVHAPSVNSQALQSDLQKAILQHLDGDKELPPLAVLVMGAEPGSAMQSTLFPGLEKAWPSSNFRVWFLPQDLTGDNRSGSDIRDAALWTSRLCVAPPLSIFLCQDDLTGELEAASHRIFFLLSDGEPWLSHNQAEILLACWERALPDGWADVLGIARGHVQDGMLSCEGLQRVMRHVLSSGAGRFLMWDALSQLQYNHKLEVAVPETFHRDQLAITAPDGHKLLSGSIELTNASRRLLSTLFVHFCQRCSRRGSSLGGASSGHAGGASDLFLTVEDMQAVRSWTNFEFLFAPPFPRNVWRTEEGHITIKSWMCHWNRQAASHPSDTFKFLKYWGLPGKATNALTMVPGSLQRSFFRCLVVGDDQVGKTGLLDAAVGCFNLVEDELEQAELASMTVSLSAAAETRHSLVRKPHSVVTHIRGLSLQLDEAPESHLDHFLDRVKRGGFYHVVCLMYSRKDAYSFSRVRSVARELVPLGVPAILVQSFADQRQVTYPIDVKATCKLLNLNYPPLPFISPMSFRDSEPAPSTQEAAFRYTTEVLDKLLHASRNPSNFRLKDDMGVSKENNGSPLKTALKSMVILLTVGAAAAAGVWWWKRRSGGRGGDGNQQS